MPWGEVAGVVVAGVVEVVAAAALREAAVVVARLR